MYSFDCPPSNASISYLPPLVILENLSTFSLETQHHQTIMNVDTDLDQIRSLMDRRANIRNMSVIAHGKSERQMK